MASQSEHGGADLKAVDTIRRTEREPGPNDLCPCNSGKKYKKCHGRIGGGGIDDITPSAIPTRGHAKEHKGEVRMGG